MERVSIPGRGCSGQILIVAVAAIAVLAVFAALTIDVGHLLYSESRLQVAADAAAVAGAQKLLESRFVGNLETVARADATAEVAAFVAANIEGARIDTIFGKYENDTFTPQDITTAAMAVKVRVNRDTASAGGPVSTFFGSLMGIKTVNVGAAAVAKMRKGIYAIGGDLRPFGIPKSALDCASGTIIKYMLGDKIPWPTNGVWDTDGDGLMDWEDDDIDGDGIRNKNDPDMNGDGIQDSQQEMWAPGAFGWLDLNGGSNSTQELVQWMQNGYPGMFTIDPVTGYIMIEGSPGMRTTLKQYFDDLIGKPIVVCVYDQLTGSGANAQYRVVAFASITLTGAKLQGENDYIEIKLNMLSNVSNCLAGGHPDSNLCHTALVE